MQQPVERARWSSKVIFLLAAAGSAVGLGNVWRFPYLAGKYGGGAFLIPYLVMLLVLGIPLMILEFAIGQRMQLGAVGSFRKIRRRLSCIGLAAVLCGFVVVSYYVVVMGWSLLYVFYSFDLKWGADPKTFFLKDVLALSSGAGEVGNVVGAVLLALVVSWVLIYFSIWKGVRSVGKVVMVTMPLPVVLLVILLIRGITLEGGLGGIIFYLKPNFAALIDHEVWAAAMGQMFFSLSLAFGIMIAYASFQHEASDISKSAIATCVMDAGFSFLAGFAVFSTLGYMAARQGVDIRELAAEGPSLAFVVFPKALSLMPLAPVFAVLFFLMLLTLAIDSAFSLVEAVTTVIHDRYPNVRKEVITLYVCIVGLLSGIIFTTQAGLYYLDIVDHFITNYGLVAVGVAEALAVGWFYGAAKLRQYINEVSDIRIGVWWDISILIVIPILLISLILLSLWADLKAPYGGYPQWALICFGWAMLALVFVFSFIFAHFSHTDGDQS